MVFHSLLSSLKTGNITLLIRLKLLFWGYPSSGKIIAGYRGLSIIDYFLGVPLVFLSLVHCRTIVGLDVLILE